jgi:hypothetical protein
MAGFAKQSLGFLDSAFDLIQFNTATIEVPGLQPRDLQLVLYPFIQAADFGGIGVGCIGARFGQRTGLRQHADLIAAVRKRPLHHGNFPNQRPLPLLEARVAPVCEFCAQTGNLAHEARVFGAKIAHRAVQKRCAHDCLLGGVGRSAATL